MKSNSTSGQVFYMRDSLGEELTQAAAVEQHLLIFPVFQCRAEFLFD
jgi:hypothetical protein